MTDQVLWLDRLRLSDLAQVGGKNASLGEMIGHLAGLGVSVPGGFATTAHAFREFIDQSGLKARIFAKLATLDIEDVDALAKAGTEIRGWVIDTALTPALDQAIRAAYAKLCSDNGPSTGSGQAADVSVAVRSSATAEDLPDASFAGQQETFLNVVGIDDVLHRVKEVFASLYNDRAIAYRVHHGFKHEDVFLSAGVQLMVRSDVGASGVLFTLDTESGFRDVVFVTSSYGLGETVVQGAVNPDEFYVYKPTLRARQAGDPAPSARFQADPHGLFERSPANACAPKPTPSELQQRFSISDADVHELSKQALVIEQHYDRPMDIEWAKDGISGKLYIVQARPETVKCARPCHPAGAFPSQRQGPGAVRGPLDRPQDRRRQGARDSLDQRDEQAAAGRRAGRGHDRPGLGTDHEARVGDRHQPRRPHLPRRDHRARTRRARGRRLRQRARERFPMATTSPCPAPKATPASSTTGQLRVRTHHRRSRADAAGAAQDHDERRQPGARLRFRACCPMPASVWRGWR